MNRIGISTLPNEMIERISTFLGDKDLGNFRLASRVANSGSLFEWRKRALLDKDGIPPLLWAAICDQHNLIHYLHAIKPDIGSNLDYLAHDDMSPLAAACYFGNDKSIKALLKCGANGLAISCGGDTVLHLAAGGNHYQTLEVILQHANKYPLPSIEAIGKWQCTPLDVAFISSRNLPASKIMYEVQVGSGSKVNTSIETGGRNGLLQLDTDSKWQIGYLDPRGRRKLLNNMTPDLGITGAEGVGRVINDRSLIALSFKNPTLRMAKLLVDHGASLANAMSIPGSSHDAFRGQDLELVHLILHAGGDINLLDHHGSSLLHILVTEQYSRATSFDAILYLEVMGADMFLRNGAGRTPEELARQVGGWPEDVIQLFLCPHTPSATPDLQAPEREYRE